MELLCPAGSVAALKAAIENGADAVYVGLRNETNARNFAGLNLDDLKLAEAAAYAAERYPETELHLSVQASATNLAAIDFYRQYNIKRVVLPRVLSIQQVRALARSTDIDLEVFAFGSLCIMAEGRCYLSSYLTGQSPNTFGACSPASFVRWEETTDGRLESRLNGMLIDCFEKHETAGYPTLCKGRFDVDGERYHTLEEPTSLNTLSLLPELYKEGVKSLKIEGRQRSPSYVASLTRVWRQAIDSLLADPTAFEVQPAWDKLLASISEGSHTTLGAYHRAWK